MAKSNVDVKNSLIARRDFTRVAAVRLSAVSTRRPDGRVDEEEQDNTTQICLLGKG